MLGFIFRSCKRFRNPESMITLYKAYVRSQVEYCSIVWSPIYQNSVDKIERVQRKFTRMLAGRAFVNISFTGKVAFSVTVASRRKDTYR